MASGAVRPVQSQRFTGDIHAMPTVFFADEPMLRIIAPLPQAQFVETRIINLLHFQTLIASKAARCVLVAPGETLVDFGLRRAGEKRVCWRAPYYLAGFAATSMSSLARSLAFPSRARWRIRSFKPVNPENKPSAFRASQS
jgi:nicotinate phosphoribosyltransferase